MINYAQGLFPYGLFRLNQQYIVCVIYLQFFWLLMADSVPVMYHIEYM